jgi:CubicO group peptidase (beta-lactamase class C family)
LGKIIENASGMDYETYVRQNILEPIDINDMYIAKQKLEERRPNEAIYYSSASSPYAIDTPRMASSFGWAASAATLAWIAVKTDGRFSENDLLAPNTGISYLNRGSWTHNGALPGTTAILKVGHPFSYVVLTNSGGANFPVVIDALHNFMEKAIEQQSEWPNTNLFQPNK